ncbi:MAG: LamG-like jellyroll fold domain-containing protein [Desulfococcaceae bacterium]
MMYPFPKNLHGSVLLILIAAMSLISVLGAAVLSVTATSAYNDLISGNFIRAGYLAESGMRYAALKNLPENTYVTVWEQGGILHMTEENVPPSGTIPGNGFRVSVNDCGTESSGVVSEGSSYESQRKISGKNMKGLPCWHFDDFFWITDRIYDSCGNNQGQIKGSSWSRVCEGKNGGALKFGGSDYVYTDFRPFCEIGNTASFTAVFQARPAHGTQGTVMGVRDSSGAFSIGISGANWTWTFGNRNSSPIPVTFDRWQQVILVYDAITGIMTMRADDCLGSGSTDTYNYGSAGGTAAMPEEVKHLFLAAENLSGTPSSYFTGELDEIRIYNSAMDPALLQPVCPESGAAAWYPFNGNALDESSTAPQFDGTVTGAVLNPDRFKCPDRTWRFDGTDWIDGNIDPVNPMISAYPFSMSAWIRLDSADATEKVIFSLTGTVSDDNVQFGIYVNESSQLCLRAKESDAALSSECAPGALDTGTWYFVTAVFQDQEKRNLYLDGVSVLPIFPVVNVLYNVNDITRWAAGRWGNLTPSGYFKGAIDDISVWPGELSPAEISIMSQQRPE